MGYQGTHEDGGYLFNSIVPVKFTENSKIAKRSVKLRVQSTNQIKQWVQCIITQVTCQICKRQRLWLRLGINVDDQLWLCLNPIPIRNCNPSANPSPCPNPNRPTTPLLTLTDSQVNNNDLITNRRTITNGRHTSPVVH